LKSLSENLKAVGKMRNNTRTGRSFVKDIFDHPTPVPDTALETSFQHGSLVEATNLTIL